VKGYKRCKCRDDGKRELGNECPKLRRRDGSWNPSHGTWYGKAEQPPAPDGTRVTLRAGGFADQGEMSEWFEAALRLLAIPAKGPDGHEARMEILAMIRESRRLGADLPREDDLRLRYATGAAFQPGDSGEYLTGWLRRHEEAGDWSPATLHNYRRTCERLYLPAFGNVPLEKLTADHILKALAPLDREAERIRAARASADPVIRKSAAGLRPPGLATKKRYLAVIRSALGEAAAIEEGRPRLLAVNVAAGIRFRKSGGGKGRAKSGRIRPLLWTAERERKWRADFEVRADGLTRPRRFAAWRNTAARPGPVMVWRPEHLGTFLDAAEASRMYAAFCEIGYCALRRSEVCGQQWPEVDLDAGAFMIGSVIIQVGWAAVPKDDAKTELSEDWVKAADEVMDALRASRVRQLAERLEWGEAWADTGYVHTHEDGTPYHPDQLTGEFERIAFAAGLPPVTLRDLRHCAPTFALSAGVDIKVVCEMMRHASVKTTADIYALVLPELAAAVSAAVASMVPRRAAAAGDPSGTRGLPSVSLAHDPVSIRARRRV
jgi:integrase